MYWRVFICLVFANGVFAQSPGGVPGSAIWLRANSGTSTTTNGTAISSWNDQSSNANHVTQGTPANQPIYKNNSTDNINFNPVIRLDGSNDNLIDANGILGASSYNGAAAFTVTVTDAISNSAVLYQATAAGGPFNISIPWSNSNVYWDGTQTPSRINTAWGGTVGTPYLFTGNNDITQVTNKQILRHDGLQIVSGNNTVAYTGNNSALYVGSQGAASFYNGRIAEIIVFKIGLTSVQYNQIESYLAIKYGVTLNQNTAQNYTASDGTTIFWDASANALYRNNIAGICRDDNSALNQKQSRSINTTNYGDMVTIGLGSVEADNTSNSASFSSDKCAMLWGDDGTSTSAAMSVPGSPLLRMTRLWKIQETGTVGTVLVQIPVTAFAPGATSVSLIQSADATLNSSDNILPLTLNGSNYELSIDFSNGDYFSFAHLLTPSPGGVVDGLTLWYKANDGISTNTLWYDRSPSEQNAVPSAGSSSLIGSINFNPAWYLDGASAFVSPLTAGVSGNYSLFGVSKMEGTLNKRVFTNKLTNDLFGYWNGAENSLYIQANPSILSPATATTNLKLYDLLRNTTGAYTMRMNGSQLHTGTTSANSTWQPMIGGWTNGTEYSKVFVPEFVSYNRELNGTERLQVESYLAIKYGITVDQTTPQNYLASDGTTVYWDATANATYKYNITGICRDDNAALNQKQSRSSNTSNNGDLITIGLGTIATDNSNNANSLSSDKTALLWGDNGSATSFTTPLSGNTSVNRRMDRLWKVQITGTVGAVELALKDIGFSSNIYLIQSNDATIDNTDNFTLLTNTTLNGTAVFTTTTSFSNGQYFTFGTQTVGPGGVFGTTIWLRADAETSTTANGATVNSWKDQSKNANHVFQGTTANQPLYKNNSTDNINYNPVVQFDGINDNMSDVNGMIGTATCNGAAAFTVTKTDAITASSVFNEATGSGGQFNLHLPWSNSNMYWDGTITPSRVNVVWGGTLGVPYLFSGLNDNTLALNRQIARHDGLQIVSGNNSVAYTGNNSPLYIGSIAAGNYFNGRMGEVILYRNSLTTNERNKIESYLAIKYGIVLDVSNGTYINSSGSTIYSNATTGYWNKIIGIGRDDNSALVQRQSHPLDDSFRLYGGTLAADNSTNSFSFSSDLSFVVIGANSGVMCAQAATLNELPVGCNLYSRLDREWEVTKTNFSQSFNMDFVLASCANTGNVSVADLVLLVDDDGNFAAGVTNCYTAGAGLSFSYTGNTITVTGISDTHIPDNATRFITIASGSSATPLPVSSIAYKAVCDQHAILLSWETESEINNSHFEIERSTDAIDYETIATIPGHGTTTEPQHYHYADETAVRPPVLYYRFTQYDTDQKITHSKVISVNGQCPENEAYVQIYPNPAGGDFIHLNYFVQQDETALVKILDASGRVVLSTVILLKPDKLTETLDIRDLAKGIYTFVIESEHLSKKTEQFTRL